VTDVLVYATVVLPLVTGGLALLARGAWLGRLVVAGALLTAAAAGGLGIVALADHADPAHGPWYVVDAAGGVYLLVVAAIGLLSALASPGYLGPARRGFFPEHRSRPVYYAALLAFWAVLLAVPLVDNLVVAWILVEATTAASALLVAFTGSERALEAGWKYLVLTTLGLTVALLGIVVLYALLADGDASLWTLDWDAIHAGAVGADHDAAVFALVLILAGLAAKIGWAPVHNWLPDAHSEAPPPVSALLSAALLPTVMLVAWRTLAALEPAVGGTGGALFLAFGLVSLAVAVPFLWRRLPLKRLLAYSSLEHMGVLALGIGFATPLALAGVVVHVAGHALAKSLGFYATIPLLRRDRTLATDAPVSLNSTSPAAAGAVGLSLASLSGLPPSPLFVSEVLILAGGVAAGEIAVVAVAAALLALGFLGLAHALIEGVAGDAPREPVASRHGERRLIALTAAIGCALLALTAGAYALVDSALVADLMRGVA